MIRVRQVKVNIDDNSLENIKKCTSKKLNIKDEDIEIKKGDRIGQAIFTPYLVADNDTANGERNGGFGSTN